ncbi:hypothetical protein [Saccharicrinis sp. FJH54]|uniref:hypothetical protein n=1 Tax=Saccharicrinis sp. FJH54 TaxID=3344665 RepID=UPI0035D4A69E
MKKLLCIALILLSYCTISCEDPNKEDTVKIEYISVQPGGCNLRNLSTEIKSILLEEQDTLLIQMNDDTLNAFIGIRYICCAPFETHTDFNNDTLFIKIKDTCKVDQESCYCRCMCYYTWNFKFRIIEQQTYYYLITLYDPVSEETMIFRKGSISLTDSVIQSVFSGNFGRP